MANQDSSQLNEVPNETMGDQRWWQGTVETSTGQPRPYRSSFKHNEKLALNQRKRSQAIVTTHKILEQLHKCTMYKQKKSIPISCTETSKTGLTTHEQQNPSRA